MNNIHLGNREEREIRNLKFIISICIMFWIFVNVIIRIGAGNIDLTISLVAIIEIAAAVLLYCILYMVNTVRIARGFSTDIKGWKSKSKMERTLFILEFSYILVSYATFVSLIEMFTESNYLLIKFTLYVTIAILTIIMRMNKGYNKIAHSILSKLILIGSIGAFLVLCVYVNRTAWNTCMQKKTFVFDNIDEFEKCKKLYNKRYQSYIVLEYGNNSAQLRALTDESIDMYFAESEDEFNEFININTMGLDTYVPVLSGDCSFEKGSLSAEYEPVFADYDLRREERDAFTEKVNSYIIFEIMLLLGIMIAANERIKIER